MRNDKWLIEKNKFPKEMQLLLLCSVKEMSQEHKRKAVGIISSGLDWELFYQFITKHRVYPLVFKNLAKDTDITLDEDFGEKLRDIYRKNSLDMLTLTAETIRVSKALEKEGIKVIVMKGPTLGYILYGDITSRTSTDLDLLVSESDVEAAGRILQEEGCNFIDHLSLNDISPLQLRTLDLNDHHYEYYNGENIYVELHWSWGTQLINYSFEELWASIREVTVQGNRINMLSREDDLIYLFFHGAKHGWNRLRWLSDITEIINQQELDWELVQKKSQRHGVTTLIHQTLILAESLYDAAIPEPMVDVVRKDTKAYRLAYRSVPIFMEAEKESASQNNLQIVHNKRYFLELNSSLRKRPGFIKKMFKPNRADFKSIKISDERFYLYYILRPFLLMKRFCERIIQSLFNRNR